MSDVFKAISDPTRRKILAILKEKDLTAGEIAEPFEMSKPAISKHLDILKNANLISCQKNGQFLVYSINTSTLQNILGEFLNFFDTTQEASDIKRNDI